jgi:hypothetical protein
VVNRVHYQDVTFVLLKNGTPVAQSAPNKEKVCSGRNLAAVSWNFAFCEDFACKFAFCEVQ